MCLVHTAFRYHLINQEESVNKKVMIGISVVVMIAAVIATTMTVKELPSDGTNAKLLEQHRYHRSG